VQADILFFGIAGWKGFPSEYCFCLLLVSASQVSQSSSRISFSSCFAKEDCRCHSGRVIIYRRSPWTFDFYIRAFVAQCRCMSPPIMNSKVFRAHTRVPTTILAPYQYRLSSCCLSCISVCGRCISSERLLRVLEFEV
jgi:hypothetical protein